MKAKVCADPYLEMDGPILVLAGPGTGKTYQLAKRIQTLVDTHGVIPAEITVITFTKETAKGMRNKISERGKEEYIESSKRPANIVTMHSLGFKIIAEHPESVGLKGGVSIVADNDLRAAFMRDAAYLVGLTEDDAKVALKDKGRANSSTASAESTMIIAEYDKILRACNAVDYDDQILLACKILESNASALAKYQASTKHLLIDEYQDINSDQDRLIKLLSNGQTEGLFAVGDDDQSIYGFRGGEPKFIRNFGDEFANAQVLQLQISRRCLKNILDCAVSLVVTFDKERVIKADPIYTETDEGLVIIWNMPSESSEASYIANMIYAKSMEGAASDFFVLVPNRNYVAPIASALRNKGIGFEIVSSSDSDATWEQLKLLKTWIETPTDLLTRHVIETVLSSGVTSMPGKLVRSDAKKQARVDYCNSVAHLWKPVIKGSNDLSASMEESSKSNDKIKEIYDLMIAMRDSYLSGDLNSFLDSVRYGLNVFLNVDEFFKCLSSIDNKADTSSSTSAQVRVLTAQSSKGLEADCVFIVGLEENTIPKNVHDTASTAEEARLTFVAMTRAKKELHLLHTRTRTGASSYKAKSFRLNPSAFITSLPDSQIEKRYISAKSSKKKAAK